MTALGLPVRVAGVHADRAEVVAFVADDGTETRVRWRLSRGTAAWRCDTHGPQPRAHCEHARAVERALLPVIVKAVVDASNRDAASRPDNNGDHDR